MLREQAISVRTLQRVLSVVDWPRLSGGDPAAWLYFYETFLEGYDPALRRATRRLLHRLSRQLIRSSGSSMICCEPGSDRNEGSHHLA